MFDVFYSILQISLKDLQFHYMDTDSFVLCFTEGNVDDEHMDLSNLDPRSGFPDPPIKTDNKLPGKFKHELSSKVIEEFIALSPKTYSFKNYPKNTKEKGIKNCNNAKQEEYYNALVYNTERTVDGCKTQKVVDNMTTTITSKISINTFDDKRFFVNNIKKYPHDEKLYLFKRDLIKKINTTPIELLIKLGLDVSKESLQSLIWEPAPLINNIKELTINDDRKLILAAITL